VLQVLDKRGSPSFTLRDMELLAVFARQATTAITATRVQRDTSRLLREVLRQIGDGELDDDAVERLVSEASRGLDAQEDSPFWRVIDDVSTLRGMGDQEMNLVADILEVVARHAQRGRRRV
jgi:hypothetical protein